MATTTSGGRVAAQKESASAVTGAANQTAGKIATYDTGQTGRKHQTSNASHSIVVDVVATVTATNETVFPSRTGDLSG